ncbi:MAG: DsbA family protein [Erythrobacter sp.]
MNDSLKSSLLTAALALVFGFAGAAAWSYSGLGDARTKDYLLANPDILPQMAEAYQSKQAQDRLAGVSAQVMTPFPGAVIGNPNGSKVLVEFTDYNCPYCAMSQADVQRLVESDPEVKVVIREWSIFQGSEIASKMALAAAMQGKYAAFHDAMFRLVPVSPESVEAAAREAGLDLVRARKDAESDQVAQELARNQALASELGFTGTPSWVTKTNAFEGAVGFNALKEALEPGDS